MTLAWLLAQAEHQTSDTIPVPHHSSSTPAQPPALDSAPTDAVLDPKPLSAELQAEEPGSKGPLLKHKSISGMRMS